MAWESLKTAISSVIKANGQRAITGNVLQTELFRLIDAVGATFGVIGIATPQTNPGTPDGRVCYFATTLGVYPNFGNLNITNQGLSLLTYEPGIGWNQELLIGVIEGTGQDGADAPNLISQYSTDGNSWHSTWITGDLYIRTSNDGGLTYSVAMRFVGPQGPQGNTGQTGASGSQGPAGANGLPGADAPELQINYSSNGTSWHSTYVFGDIYQRFSTDGGTTWGETIPLGLTPTFTADVESTKLTSQTFANFINASNLPFIFGGYDFIITLEDGVHDMGAIIDQLNLRGIGGNIKIKAENALSEAGTNQASTINFDSDGQINGLGLHCNLHFESIKFTTAGSNQNVLANLKGLGKASSHFCYFDFDLGTEPDSVVGFLEGFEWTFLYDRFRESSTNAAQNSTAIELSRDSGLGKGGRATFIGCESVDGRPFLYAATGVGEIALKNSDTAFTNEASEEEGSDIIVLTTQGTTSQFVLSAKSITDITETTAILNVRFNVAGRIYWSVLPAASSTPLFSDIIAGTYALDYGFIDTDGGIIETDSITGLSEATGYKVHMFGETALEERSVVNTLAFTSTIPQLVAPAITIGTETETTVPMTITDPNTSPNESNLEIQRSADGSTGWSQVALLAADSTSFEDTGRTGSTNYYYRARAVGNGTETLTSEWSEVVAATTSAPAAPNMIANGTFDSSTGWTTDGPVVISGGVASFTSGSEAFIAQSQANMSIPLPGATALKLKFTVSNAPSGLYLGFYSSDQGQSFVSPAEYANGNHEIQLTSPGYVGVGGLMILNFMGLRTGDLDNVVIEADNNIVSNYSFADDLTGWSGAGWAQDNGSAVHTPGSANPLSQTISGGLVEGATYRVVLSVNNGDVGTTQVSIGGTLGTVQSGVSNYVEEIVAGATDVVQIIPSSDSNRSVGFITIVPVS